MLYRNYNFNWIQPDHGQDVLKEKKVDVNSLCHADT